MVLATKYITTIDPSNATRPRHIAYCEYGDPASSNVIICVHGLSRNGMDFAFLADALSKKYRVLCPDMAGRGNSDWLVNKSDYNYATYLADIMLLLKQLQLGSIDWIGTSMGGIIGMMLAAGNPGIIKRLVLNDIGEVVSAEGLKRIINYVGTSAVFPDREKALAYLQSVLASFGITSEKQWQYIMEISFNVLADGSYALRYDPDIGKPLRAAAEEKSIEDLDLSSFWNAVKCPALILRGAMSDILSQGTASKMCEGRPDVRLVELPGIGHAPALLDEYQIKLITDWLDNTLAC